MKKVIWIFLFLTYGFSQSYNATITLYKDKFALVSQPVEWSMIMGENQVSYNLLPKGMFTDSPFLVIPGATIISQTLDADIFHSQEYYLSKLGYPIKLKTIEGKSFEGLLLDYTSAGITLLEDQEMIYIPSDKIEYFTMDKFVENFQFKPSLEWSIITNESGNKEGSLIYLSSGFDWNAIYRFIMDRETGKGEFISEALITNNSGIDFLEADLRLVEGELHRTNRYQDIRKLSKQALPNQRVILESEVPSTQRETLGDYHEYFLSDKQMFYSDHQTTIRLYTPRVVQFNKEYIFENAERVQRDEPLVTEISIANTKENSLNIPLPAGKVELYHSGKNGFVKFVGEDYLDQIPTGGTATLTAGRAFDVRGKRKVLHYDRQRKSEEATIELILRNTKEVDVSVKVIEHISGDWVIRDASDMYIKKDASTIHFPLKVEAGETKTVTYTYRKEWK